MLVPVHLKLQVWQQSVNKYLEIYLLEFITANHVKYLDQSTYQKLR